MTVQKKILRGHIGPKWLCIGVPVVITDVVYIYILLGLYTIIKKLISFFGPELGAHIQQQHVIMNRLTADSCAWFIEEGLWEDGVQVTMKESYQSFFKMIDMFQNSANVHRLTDGAVLMRENRLLDRAMKLAQDFLETAAERKIQYQKRNKKSHRFIKRLKPVLIKETFPEVLSNQIMTYLPPISRMDNLRKKYSDSFLIDGLKTKTVKRINIIYKHFLQAAKKHISYMKQTDTEITGAALSCETGRNSIPIFEDTEYVWSESVSKKEKIDSVMGIYITLEQIHCESLITKTFYDDFTSRLMRLLHAFVIAVKPTPKKQRTRRTANA